MKNHSLFGYDIVKSDLKLSKVVKKIILYHHEKMDGSGYPSGRLGDDIEDYIWVVAIADYFDALSTNRPYRRALSVKQALKLLLSRTKNHFKVPIVHRFVNEMIILFRESNFYPVGSYVLLNTDEMAKVIDLDMDHILYPKIEIVTDGNGKKLKNPMIIDLGADSASRFITHRVK